MLLVLLLILATFSLSVPAVKSIVTVYIRADGSVDGTTYLVSSDYVNYDFTGDIYSSIVVERSDIVIDGKGYTLSGAGLEYGFGLLNVSNVTIKNTSIIDFNNGPGIYVQDASNNTLIANNITNCRGGVDLLNSSKNNISANSVTGSAPGIRLYNSNENIATENVISNAATDNGITLYNASNNTISANNVTYGATVGISVCGSYNILALNNVTNNKWFGIEIANFGRTNTNNSLLMNTIKNNQAGILLSDSGNNSLLMNDISENNGYGVFIDTYCDRNILLFNNITNNLSGIDLSSTLNIIAANILAYNSEGIRLNYNSNNAIIYNNFLNNTLQVTPSSWGINVWDFGYPRGGNYWSDYTGVDADDDGIGDTAYVINSDNQDQYPLMTPWTPLEHEIFTSTIAPPLVWSGNSVPVNITITNLGINNEADVEFSLLINGNTVDSATIPILNSIDSYTVSYPWTPTTEGVYNITAYALPRVGETSLKNNNATTFVTVKRPPVGVRAGDWVNLTYTIPVTSEWYKIEFLNVVGTIAIMQHTTHQPNGTEQAETFPVDVMAGDTDYVIPANLTVGEIICLKHYGNISIVGEITRTYAGTSRVVVYTNISQSFNQYTYYWDKLTGVLVELSLVSGVNQATLKVSATNLWQGDLTPSPTPSPTSASPPPSQIPNSGSSPTPKPSTSPPSPSPSPSNSPSQPPTLSPSPEPQTMDLPMEYVAAIAALVVVVIIVTMTVALRRRK